MKNRIFHSSELKNLSTPYPDRIISCIDQKKLHQALSLTEEMRNSRILLHDFFADSCTILWSWVGEQMGEEILEDMFRYIFAQSARRQYFDAAPAQVLPHLTVFLLAKSWRAHSCFGVGEFPGKFSITEDHEKFTFHLHPCGSGSRLWQKGWYEPGRGGRVSEKAWPWTYNRKGFPYYCIHCPFLNEILPFESGYNNLLWPVDPLAMPDGECAWQVYKNSDLIPDRYYERLGLKRQPKGKDKKSVQTGRYFSDEELIEMARPIPDRIKESLRQGNLLKAKKLLRDVKDEFLALHDLYIMMLSATFTFIADKRGEKSLGEALYFQFEKCIETQILLKIKSMPFKERIVFLSTIIFSTDNCNCSGYNKGRFKIRETDNEIIFILDPCGSGGRLLRSGSCEPMPLYKKAKERIENLIISFSAQNIPLPESLIKLVFPLIVTHFTQRKPSSQGKTREKHSWSFNGSDIPYYCCQCGVIQEKSGDRNLKIFPPQNKKSPCIWRLTKE